MPVGIGIEGGGLGLVFLVLLFGGLGVRLGMGGEGEEEEESGALTLASQLIPLFSRSLPSSRRGTSSFSTSVYSFPSPLPSSISIPS